MKGEINMKKGIIVTEQNFESVLSKLQKICNAYKMLTWYKVYDADKEKKEFRSCSIGLYKRVVYNEKKDRYRKVVSLKYNSTFTEVEKHRIREKYEDRTCDDYISEKIYEERKPLILISYASSVGLPICEGDVVIFYPFKGFTVWTDNMFTAATNSGRIYYKHTFFPDIFKGKIKDLQYEINKRRKEWEEDADDYLAMEEKWRSQNDNLYDDDDEWWGDYMEEDDED